MADTQPHAPASDDSEAFWKAEKMWQERVMSTKLELSVGDPQTMSSTFKSFTTYEIVSTIGNEAVRRRYSDFEWIREVLVARYNGMSCPRLPEKRVMNQGADFIQERMVGLNAFMRRLMSNPYFRKDKTVEMFLSIRDSTAWEQMKKGVKSGDGSDPSSNEGLHHWFGCLQHYEMPIDADAAVSEFTSHCEAMEKCVQSALRASSSYFQALKSVASEMQLLKETLSDWQAAQTDAHDTLSQSLSGVRSDSGKMAAVLTHACNAFSESQSLAVFAPNEHQILVMDGLVNELQRVAAVKELIQGRQAAQQSYVNAWSAKDKLEHQQKSFRDKGKEDKATKMEPQLAAAKDQARVARERLHDITKGLLHFEAPQLSARRVDAFVKIIGQLATLNISSGLKTQEIWTKLLNALEMDQNEMVTQAQATLQGAAFTDGAIFLPQATGAIMFTNQSASTPDAAVTSPASEEFNATPTSPAQYQEVEL